MKGKIFITIVVIICLLCESGYAFMEGEGTVSLESNSPLINKGNSFIVKLFTENIEDIYGFHIKLSFDKELMQSINKSIALDKDITDKNHFVAINTIDNNKGAIELMVTLLKDERPLNKNTLIGTINFKALKKGKATVSIEKSTLLNKRGQRIDHNVKGIALTVKEVIKKKDKSFLNDSVILSLPDGSCFDDFEISINKNSSSSSLSDIYTIQSLYPLDCELILSIKLDKSINVKHPGIYYFNEERNKWIYLGGELKNNYISTSINRLGSFCVFENTNYKDYKDIDNSYWAKEYIERLTSMGIVKGVDQDNFNPTGYVTRAEMAKMISLALDLNGKLSDIHFKDKSTIPQWAKVHVGRIVENRIMIGYGDNEFKANNPITRAEMAVIIYRILRDYHITSSNFLYADDKEIPEWAKNSVYQMYNLGIFTGYDDRTFKPSAYITRAEACKVLVKLLEFMKVI